MKCPNIFEDPFIPVRRRSLLPVLLKIYIWAGMVLGGFLFLLASFLMPFRFLGGFRRWEVAIGLGIEITWAALIFSITALLWFERKWAIRYNWVGGGLYFLSLCFILYEGVMIIPMFVIAVMTIPYWIMLYRIQDLWERNAS